MGKTVRLRWLGSRPVRVLDLPVPLLSLSEKIGEVRFDPEGDLPEEFLEPLMALPGAKELFEVVTEKPPQQPQPPSPARKGPFGRPLPPEPGPSSAAEGTEAT